MPPSLDAFIRADAISLRSRLQTLARSDEAHELSNNLSFNPPPPIRSCGLPLIVRKMKVMYPVYMLRE